MPVNTNFNDGKVLFAANLTSAFAFAANTSGDDFDSLTIQGIDIATGLQTAFNTANAAFISSNTVTTSSSAAFTKANNATNIATFASTTANNALNLAQSSYSDGNTTAVLAQAAFDSGNSVQSFMQTGYTTANNALNVAQSAFAQANTGGPQANVQPAFDQANTATVLAQAAFDEANTGGGSSANVTPAFNQANSALSLAQSAYGRANTVDGIASLTFNTIAPLLVNNGSGQNFTGNGTATFQISNASVSANGVVQLNDTLTSTSTTQAATANTIKILHDAVTAAFTVANTGAGGSSAAAAFNQANSALNYAQSAYSQANAAETLATTANTTATSALSVGTSAFNKANTVNTYAQWVGGVANSALVTGQAAYDEANTVYAWANNVALYIASAYAEANDASALAANADNYAVGAFIEANSAFTRANFAYTNSNAAFSAGNTNATNITAVNTFASGAYLQANTAQTNATNANNTAIAAFVEANSAMTTAVAAFNAANTGGGSATGTTTVIAGNALTANGGTSITVGANGIFILAANNANGTSKGVVVLNSATNSQLTASSGQAATPWAVNAVMMFAQAAFAQANAASGPGANVQPAFDQANSALNLSQSAFTTANNALPESGGTMTGNIVFTNNSTISGTGNLFLGTANSSSVVGTTPGDGFKLNVANFFMSSWQGIGFATNLANTTTGALGLFPPSLYPISMNPRNGSFIAYGNVYGLGNDSRLSGSRIFYSTGNNTVTLDTSAWVASLSNTTPSNAGTGGFAANNQLIDAYNNVYGVKSVTGSNTVSTLSLHFTPLSYAQPPISVDLTPVSGSGTGTVTAQLNWTNLNTLRLNPSGNVVIQNNLFVGGEDVGSALNQAQSNANAAFVQANSALNLANSAFANSNGALALTGGTMTGPLVIASTNTSSPFLYISSNTSNWPSVKWNTTQPDTTCGYFESQRNGITRWSVEFGSTITESGANVGSDFLVHRFSDTGSSLGTPFTITRSTGDVGFTGNVVINQGLSVSGTNLLAATQAAFTTANAAATTTSVTAVNNFAAGAYTKANSFSAIVGTVGTTANNALNLAQSAFAQANSASGGTTYPSITNASANAVIQIGNANTQGIMSQFAYANGSFANTGDAQWASYLLRNQSTVAGRTYNLSLNGANTTSTVYSSINQIVMGMNNSLYAFNGTVAARDVTNNFAKIWEVKGGVKRGTTAGTITYIGTPVINIIAADNSTNNWIINLATDTTNAAMLVTATGSANTTNWVSKIDIVQVA